VRKIILRRFHDSSEIVCRRRQTCVPGRRRLVASARGKRPAGRPGGARPPGVDDCSRTAAASGWHYAP